MKKTPSKRSKGNTGEDIACKFIEKQGFVVIVRNFYRKWGELDIVAEKDGITHFFEVKSVTVNSDDVLLKEHKPEDNVNSWKMHKLRRITETYLDFSGKGLDAEFKFHVLCVYMNYNNRIAKVKWLKDVII